MKFIKFYLLLVFIYHPLIIEAAAVGSFQQITGSPFTAASGPAWSTYSSVVSGNLFAAVPNYYDQSVSVYSVDQSTGAFTAVTGAPFATGVNPAWLVYSPVASGNLFAAVVNNNDNTASVYLVDQSTGAFTEISGSPFATGASPFTVAYSPVVSGNLFAAVTNSDGNTVSVYSVDQSTGAFTEISGSPFATGSGPYTVAYSPVVSGNLFAAITNFNDNTVSVYSVDQSTGAFTEISGSPFATGVEPYGMTYSPVVSGNLFAAAVNLNDSTVSVYSVDQSTGAFTEISGSPFATGNGVNEVAYSPLVLGDLFAAVVNFNDNTVSVYSVDQSTGAFTEISGSPFATGGAPDGIAYSPVVSGNLFAVVANFSDGTASVYQVTLPVQPPADIEGCKTKNVVIKTDLINIVSWNPPAAGPAPVSYYIYRDAGLTDLAAIIPASLPLRFVDYNRHKHVVYTYYVVSVDANNNFSTASSVTVTQHCHCF